MDTLRNAKSYVMDVFSNSPQVLVRDTESQQFVKTVLHQCLDHWKIEASNARQFSDSIRHRL